MRGWCYMDKDQGLSLLQTAMEDLGTATNQTVVLRTRCNHAQQSVEKTFKAILCN